MGYPLADNHVTFEIHITKNLMADPVKKFFLFVLGMTWQWE
jgi:hypothetical protein